MSRGSTYLLQQLSARRFPPIVKSIIKKIDNIRMKHNQSSLFVKPILIRPRSRSWKFCVEKIIKLRARSQVFYTVRPQISSQNNNGVQSNVPLQELGYRTGVLRRLQLWCACSTYLEPIYCKTRIDTEDGSPLDLQEVAQH